MHGQKTREIIAGIVQSIGGLLNTDSSVNIWKNNHR